MTKSNVETRTLAEWKIPSPYRDTDDFVIRVERTGTEPARVVVGDGTIWHDDRTELVAARLRVLVHALALREVHRSEGS